jgi:hypothetical protein
MKGCSDAKAVRELSLPFVLSALRSKVYRRMNGILKAKPPGVARQQVTFLVLPRKVTKRGRPRCAAPSGFPALLDWSGGCGTRATRSDSPRRHPLTSFRYSADAQGRRFKSETPKPARRATPASPTPKETVRSAHKTAFDLPSHHRVGKF